MSDSTWLAYKSSDVGWVEQSGTQHLRLATPIGWVEQSEIQPLP
jgi:hypothetical protein